jgi:hypothetical protein
MPPATEPQASSGVASAISFGPYRLFSAQRLLLEGDKPVRLGGRAFDILVALIERAGELVTKEALIARVWPQSISGPVHERGIRAEDAARRRMASRLPPADPRSALCSLSLAPWAPDHPAAEEYFRRALDIANGQGALSWELRLGLSLCRLRVTQGRGDEGRRLLAAI